MCVVEGARMSSDAVSPKVRSFRMPPRVACFVVSTGSVSGETATDSTLYYVDADAPGVSIDGPWNGLGLRANGEEVPW